MFTIARICNHKRDTIDHTWNKVSEFGVQALKFSSSGFGVGSRVERPRWSWFLQVYVFMNSKVLFEGSQAAFAKPAKDVTWDVIT